MPVFQVTVQGKSLNIFADSRRALQEEFPGVYVNPIPRPSGRADRIAVLKDIGNEGPKLRFPGRNQDLTLDQVFLDQQQPPLTSGGTKRPYPTEMAKTIAGQWGDLLGGGVKKAYGAVQMGDVFGPGRPQETQTPQDRTLELAARAGGTSPTRSNLFLSDEEAFQTAQGQQLQAALPRTFSRGIIGDEIDPTTGLPFTTVARPPTVDRTTPVVPSAPSAALAGRGVITDEIDPTTGLPFTTVPRMAAPDDRFINPYNMPADTSAAAAAARFREQLPATPPTVPTAPTSPTGMPGFRAITDEIDPNTGLPFGRAVIPPTTAAPPPGAGPGAGPGPAAGPFGVGTGITVQAPLGQPGQSELFGMGLPSLEEQSLGAVFSQYLQDQGAARGINPLVSNYATGQGPLAEQLFGAAQRIGGGNPLVSEANQFRDFLSRTPNFGTQSLVGTALTDISNATRQGLIPGGEAFSRFNPQNIQEASDLVNLARAASQRNVSPFIRRDFYQRPGMSNDQLFNTFAANRDRGNQQGFADYVGQTFGLRNFGSQLGLA